MRTILALILALDPVSGAFAQTFSQGASAPHAFSAAPVSVVPSENILLQPGMASVELPLLQLPDVHSQISVESFQEEQGRRLLVPQSFAEEAILPAVQAVEQPKSSSLRRVSSRLQKVSKGLRSLLNSAGPASKAGTESAHGLGGRILRLLTGETARGADGDEALVSAYKPGRFASSQFSGAKLSASPVTQGTLDPKIVQQKMLKMLDFVAALYTEHYEPIEWKQSHMGVDFKAEYQKARARILAKPGIKQQEFQDILADFVYATRDYHVGIEFYSTEKATLPFMILGAGGKYYLADIDRKALPESKFPFQDGDEVVQFDGKPVADAAAALTRSANVPTTDARLSEMSLTRRRRSTGDAVPQGPVSLRVRGQDGVVREAMLQWTYSPEQVPMDIPMRDAGLGTDSAGQDHRGAGRSWRESLRESLHRLIPYMAHPHARIFAEEAEEDGQGSGGSFRIGAKKSFVPRLGTLLWQLPEEAAAEVPFDAYIYKNEQGQKIGYIRIPSYMGESDSVAFFANLMAQYEKHTDALVIDQVDNPGGSLFYMYNLLTTLTDRPLSVPKHRISIDESDAAWAAELLQRAAQQAQRKALAEEMGEELGALQPEGGDGLSAVVGYAKFILSELKAGRRMTGLVHLLGVDKIQPQPKARYTKPILVLINELDFSCADFFPAIMQDNKRAKIFGVRTSGAGGGVKSIEFPNQLGIAGLNYTWTLAERADGRPIENLGVQPDISYQITAKDLKSDFSGYAAAVNSAVSGLLAQDSNVSPQKPEGPRFGPGSRRVWVSGFAFGSLGLLSAITTSQFLFWSLAAVGTGLFIFNMYQAWKARRQIKALEKLGRDLYLD
ncbi:MAG: protease-like activity factor CPAF [Elusimicrobiota bacterium]|jgi:hypothetical protein